jgi:hypothetical protein
VLISGCGTAGNKTARPASRSTPATAQASLNSYINSVTALETPIEKAASQFFHSPRTSAVQLRRTKALRDAYDLGAGHLSKMTPPSVGVTAQRNLVKAWSRVASQLAGLTRRRPFSYSSAYSVAAAAEPLVASAYNAIVSLP